MPEMKSVMAVIGAAIMHLRHGSCGVGIEGHNRGTERMKSKRTRAMRNENVLLVCCAALMAPSAVSAQTQLTVVPSVSVSAIADDNIFTAAARSSDQTTLLGPGID